MYAIAWFERFDRRVTATLARIGIPALRVSLGIIFLWFGALKFFPGLSSAEGLAVATIRTLSFGFVPDNIALISIATVETAIGLGLILGVSLRFVLLMLWMQMLGTLTPLLLFPTETFSSFPWVPTLEGQYIIKNLILISAAIVIGGTVRGGRLVAER